MSTILDPCTPSGLRTGLHGAVDDELEGFRRGDPAAIRVLYQRYGRLVFSVASSITRDRELAADVVQETFVKAWRAAEGFDTTRDLAPWLSTIARRAAIDAVRRESRPTQGGHEPEVDGVVEPVSFERTWEVHEVRQAVDDLPPRDAEIVRLTYHGGFTHEQIAERMGLPLGTVKSALHRAQRRLATDLGYLRDERNQSPPESVLGGEDS